MAGLALAWPSREERWRRPALVAASVVLHAAILGAMAFQAIQDPRRYSDGVIDDPIFPDRPISVWIEPRPLLPGETARVRRPAMPAETIQSGPILSAPTAEPALSIRNRQEEEGESARLPQPRISAPAPGAAAPPADVGTWTVRPERLGDRVGRGLRTRGLGCASSELLTETERSLCQDRFAARAEAAMPIRGSGDSRRDARFDRAGARALEAYERRRAPLSLADNPSCGKAGPAADCGVEIHVELFSSTDGFLPGLRRDDD